MASAVTSEIRSDSAAISLYSDEFNRRVRIDDYSGAVNDVLRLVIQSIPVWTEKLIIKARTNDLIFFELHGFEKEAYIEGYFNGTDMHFLAKYFSQSRSVNTKAAEEQHIIDTIVSREASHPVANLDMVSVATKDDARELALLYASIFKIYPTPLGDAGHIIKTFDDGTKYVVMREQGAIVSVASAEINRKYSNAELTDCATRPEAQGKGYMRMLLSSLEKMLLPEGVGCLYTIARAESYAMNKAFFQLNFKYGGRMTNNCYIYSGLEDMNVWYKSANT